MSVLPKSVFTKNGKVQINKDRRLQKMKEKPIIFSTPMVRAILEGRKTMTRRVITRIKGKGPVTEFGKSNTLGYQWHFRDKHLRWHDVNSITPPYQTGDILWGRETFTRASDGEYIYRADPVFDGCTKGDFAWPWTTPIFMPHEAARIFLEVKAVRIEQIHDISEGDARMEATNGGCLNCGCPEPCGCDHPEPDCRDTFIRLWDKLNAKRDFAWEKNPWVWVIEFRRIER
jgi:hypothetical protein